MRLKIVYGIILFFFFSAALLFTEENAAFVFSLRGDVTVESGGGANGEERALAAGAFIAPGDIIRTRADSRVTLIFPDDTQVTLTGGKTLRVGNISEGEKKGGLRRLWRRITGKADEAEYTIALGTVGAVRGEESVSLGDLVLYEDEKQELNEALGAIEEQFPSLGEQNLMKAVLYEEYEQYIKADTFYTLALETIGPDPFIYDLAVDFYLKAEQYEKAAALAEEKEELFQENKQ